MLRDSLEEFDGKINFHIFRHTKLPSPSNFHRMSPKNNARPSSSKIIANRSLSPAPGSRKSEPESFANLMRQLSKNLDQTKDKKELRTKLKKLDRLLQKHSDIAILD